MNRPYFVIPFLPRWGFSPFIVLVFTEYRLQTNFKEAEK
jgi:hypothetical protein